MSVLSPKKKNVYLERINESLATFFRTIDKFNQDLRELTQLVNEARDHINDIVRTLNNNEEQDDDDEEVEEDQQRISENASISGAKLCELNENLNLSMRAIRQTW